MNQQEQRQLMAQSTEALKREILERRQACEREILAVLRKYRMGFSIMRMEKVNPRGEMQTQFALGYEPASPEDLEKLMAEISAEAANG